MYYRVQQNERIGGFLLPFLAGVAVTSPLVFFAKNQQYPYYPPPPMQYYPTPYYPPMPMYYR